MIWDYLGMLFLDIGSIFYLVRVAISLYFYHPRWILIEKNRDYLDIECGTYLFCVYMYIIDSIKIKTDNGEL